LFIFVKYKRIGKLDSPILLKVETEMLLQLTGAIAKQGSPFVLFAQEGFIKNNDIKVVEVLEYRGKINLPFIGNQTRFLLFLLFPKK